MTVRKQTSGWKTSEFWLTLSVLVAATVLRLHGDITEVSWAAAAAINTVGYAAARTAVKVSDS